MASQIRPDKKLMKLAYKLMKTAKSAQQHNDKKPDEKRRQQWMLDSSATSA